MPIAYSTRARYAQPERSALAVQAMRPDADLEEIAFNVKAIENT